MIEGISITSFVGTRREYEAITGINRALFNEEQGGDYEERQSREWQQNNPGFDSAHYDLHLLIAYHQAEQEIVGYAQGYQTPWAFDPHRYHVTVRVHPEYQKQGIGNALHDALLDELRRHGAATLRAEVHEAFAEGLAFVEKRGWDELFRSWQFTLDLRRFDPSPFNQYVDQLAAGITITTVNEEARGGTGWLPKLHALHTAVRADSASGEGYTPLPIERFAQLVGGRAESLPEAFFIAKRDDRYIGESYLQRSDQPDALDQRFTGVMPDERGRGVGLALQLRAAMYAQDEGYGRIVTWTDSSNSAMVAVNRKLGFAQTFGTVWYERRL